MLDLAGRAVAVEADAAPEASGSGHAIRSRSVALLHPLGDAEFYRHGWNSWSPTAWTRLSGPTVGIKDSPSRLLTADDAALETPHAHTGSAVGALAGEDGTVILLGALGLGSPRVGADERVLWGSSEDPDAEWYLGCGPEHEVFAEYARRVTERLGRRGSRAGRVWSSWYSFFEGVDEDLIARTVSDLRGYPFDVFQLDDGWEPMVGDWTAGPSFPSGMAATARRIADAGFRPGLWLAPLIARPGSEIARTRPDLLVHDEDGAPLAAGHNWGESYFALDTTQPEVREHLREMFERVVGWGFTYLKLDFLYAGAIPGRRRGDAQRETVYRAAVQHIRDVVGDDVYLLGSGAPMLPSVGVFDGVRVGPDTAAYWDNAERPDDPSGQGARNALANSLGRAWMAPLYELDPDAAYLRSARNLLGPLERGLTRDASHVLGFVSTSDPIAWLRDDERAELRAYLGASPTVERTGRFAWRIDGREVDFGPYLSGETPVEEASWAG